MKLFSLIAASILLGIVAIASSSESPKLTRHDAKVRTFKILLRETEKPADASDATHAAITVEGCRRLTGAFRCRGYLYPVAFSGISGSRCRFTVTVFKHSTRVVQSACQ